MNGARSLAALVSVAMLLISALAYATDVDPGWGGLWDDDDGDNVILFLTTNIVSVEPPPIADFDYQRLEVATIDEPKSADVVLVAFRRPDSRSPPRV